MKVYWIGLLLASAPFAPSLENIAYIHDTPQLKAVQINPSAFSWRVFVGSPSTPIFSFNANYYWKKVPIGVAYDRTQVIKTTVFPDSKRPFFVIDPNKKADITYKYEKGQFLTVQAGPTLLYNGEYSVEKMKEEKLYGTDSVRKTKHVALGIKNGKVIVAYFNNASVGEMAHQFKEWGCSKAMKFDGGGSCYFRFKDTQIIQSNYIPIGVYIK